MNREIFQKVIEKWKGENLEIIEPYSEEQIQNSFNKISKLISKDVFQVYATFGGLADCRMDSNLFSFWTLEQLVNENLNFKTNFTLFGDFLVFSHLYGYKYEDENISSVYTDYGSGEYTKVSESVAEFFDLYIENPLEIGLYQEQIK